MVFPERWEMKSNIKANDKQRGFTIIEVVLVLAIAGLIFLVVFLALPALQRSQRDTQRRQDAGRFASQMQQYQSNNKGAIVQDGGMDSFVNTYLLNNGDSWNDPREGKTYESGGATPGKYTYTTKVNCDGQTGNRMWKAEFGLEGGGIYCVGS